MHRRRGVTGLRGRTHGRVGGMCTPRYGPGRHTPHPRASGRHPPDIRRTGHARVTRDRIFRREFAESAGILDMTLPLRAKPTIV